MQHDLELVAQNQLCRWISKTRCRLIKTKTTKLARLYLSVMSTETKERKQCEELIVTPAVGSSNRSSWNKRMGESHCKKRSATSGYLQHKDRQKQAFHKF